MMHQSARRKLFYAFCIAFLILGTGTVLYAQGWRFDIHTWNITKVGGIFITSYPRDAAIALDGIPVKNASWLLQSGTFINDLFPKTYTLTLQKDGFRPWTRHVPVAPSLVTEVSNAVLVPSLATADARASSTVSFASPPAPTLVATSTRWSARADSRGNSSILFADAQRATSSAASSSVLELNAPAVALQWNASNILGILARDGSLLSYDPETQERNKIADDVTGFAWNQDGTKLAALEHRSLEVFDVKNSANYHRFNVPDIGNAERLLWYRDDTHLFIVYPEKTVFLDFADANLENITEVVPTHRVAYDHNLNKLYFLPTATTTVHALQFPR